MTIACSQNPAVKAAPIIQTNITNRNHPMTTDHSPTATAKSEGTAAQRLGAPVEHNPYDHKDQPDEYEAWERGWQQSAATQK